LLFWRNTSDVSLVHIVEMVRIGRHISKTRPTSFYILLDCAPPMMGFLPFAVK